MPLFEGQSAPIGSFMYNGVRYEARDVEWYFMDNHREKDGDQFFWWADWHKALGINQEIDKFEAQTMWELVSGKIESGYRDKVFFDVLHSNIYGSVAIDRNREYVFFSVVFDNGNTIKNKLLRKVIVFTKTEDGVDRADSGWQEILLPTDAVYVKDDGNKYKAIESAYTAWFPVCLV